MEYSRNIQKKKLNNRNNQNFGIWNIPGIFQKIENRPWGRKV